MDVGVSGFVLSNALVARERAPPVRVALRRVLPLLALGLATLAGKRGVDYQQHVSEYGLHWNFFFTLACVALGAAALDAALGVAPALRARPGALGAALLAAHEGLLARGGAREWVLRAPRVGLLSANKEGVASCLGYPRPRGAARAPIPILRG